MQMTGDRILVIDEAGFSCVCSAILGTEGFVVETIVNSHRNAAPLNFQEFSLVITSYPFDASFIDNINKMSKPVIILTDHISRELICILEGFDKSYCMIKPIDYCKFKQLVKQLMDGELSSHGGYSIV